VVKKSLSPEWGQSFTIAMAAEAGPLLLLQIFDQDLLSGDDEMGAVTVDLGALPPGKFDDQWRDVGACDGCPEAAGRLRLRLRFRPRRAPYLGGVLEATVVEAADLVGMDGGGLFDKNAPKTSDPYVKLLALAQGVGAFEAVGGHGKGKELAKTNVVKKSLAPQWGQHFKLTLPAQLGTLVLFHLFDQDLMSGDDPMGAIAIDLAALRPGKEDDQWRDVGPCKGCAAAAGRLRLRLRFKPTRPAVEEVAVEEEVDENLVKVGDLVHFAGGRFPVVEESRDSVGNPKFKLRYRVSLSVATQVIAAFGERRLGPSGAMVLAAAVGLCQGRLRTLALPGNELRAESRRFPAAELAPPGANKGCAGGAAAGAGVGEPPPPAAGAAVAAVGFAAKLRARAAAAKAKAAASEPSTKGAPTTGASQSLRVAVAAAPAPAPPLAGASGDKKPSFEPGSRFTHHGEDCEVCARAVGGMLTVRYESGVQALMQALEAGTNGVESLDVADNDFGPEHRKRLEVLCSMRAISLRCCD
jgi:hypothetical protein